MKTTLLSICLFGLLVSLRAQDQGFYNSLSLNFAGATRNLTGDFPLQPAENLWVPGLEYRFDYGKRLSIRMGFDYQPLVGYTVGVLDSDNFSDIRFKGSCISVGAQYRFWGDDFLKQFRMYALGDLILGREWVERRASSVTLLNPTPREYHDEALTVNASILLGFGAEYIFCERIVLRVESSIGGGLYLREEVDIIKNLRSDFGFIPQNGELNLDGEIPFFPFSELSIGWRF
ncbi:MAG: hypothetical protein AAFN10_09205 [Bacteroidota bacterium]